MPIRALHLLHMRPIPMDPHHSIDQQIVLGPHPLHRLLQRHGVTHRPIRPRPQHRQQRIQHMARKVLLDDLLERNAVLGLVGVRDGAQMAVAAVRDDGADGHGVAAEFGRFRRAMQVRDVGVDLLREDGRRVFLPGGGEHHGEQPLRFQRQVVAYVAFQRPRVFGGVGGLDGVHVGVGAREQHVVEDAFFGPRAREGFVQVVHVLGERPAHDGQEAFFEVARRFGRDVGFEVAAVPLLVRGAEEGDLEGVEAREGPDESLLVRAEAFHRFAERVGVAAGVAWWDLVGNVTG